MEELKKLPARLVAMQIYSPPSDAEMELIVSVDCVDVDVMLVSISAKPFNTHVNKYPDPPSGLHVKISIS